MSSADDQFSVEVLERLLRQVRARGRDEDHFLHLLQSAVEHVRAGVFAKDPQGRYLFVNQAAADVIGLPVAQIVGRSDHEIFPAPLAEQLYEFDRAAREARRALQREKRLPAPGQLGEVRDFFAVRVPVSQRESDPLQPLCGVWIDTTELRLAQEQLRQALEQFEQQQRDSEALRSEAGDAAVRDPLTGVYARAHFDERLRREIEAALHDPHEFALVRVEIDHFETLVEEKGSAAGDAVLQALGLQLRASTRALDTPCRLGDERFAVMLSGIGLATAHARMESVRRQCEAQTVSFEGGEARFTISVGVASYPHTTARPQALLAAAERALALARQRGGNAVALASITFDEQSAGNDELPPFLR